MTLTLNNDWRKFVILYVSSHVLVLSGDEPLFTEVMGAVSCHQDICEFVCDFMWFLKPISDCNGNGIIMIWFSQNYFQELNYSFPCLIL